MFELCEISQRYKSHGYLEILGEIIYLRTILLLMNFKYILCKNNPGIYRSREIMNLTTV